jgi:hypothetical protein
MIKHEKIIDRYKKLNSEFRQDMYSINFHCRMKINYFVSFFNFELVIDCLDESYLLEFLTLC